MAIKWEVDWRAFGLGLLQHNHGPLDEEFQGYVWYLVLSFNASAIVNQVSHTRYLFIWFWHGHQPDRGPTKTGPTDAVIRRGAQTSSPR